MISKDKLKNEAEHIIEVLCSPPYTLPDGMLSRQIFNGRVSEKNLLSDLGDYLPLFYLFGAKKFCELHLRVAAQQLEKGMLKASNTFIGIPAIYSYDYTDLLLGLIWYKNQVKDSVSAGLIINVLKVLKENFSLGENSSSIYLPSLRLRLPIIDTRDGQFIETLIGSSEFLRKELLDKLFQKLVSLPFFVETGLFPDFSISKRFKFIEKVPIIRDRLRKITFIKHNSNMIHAILAMYLQDHSLEKKALLDRCFKSMDRLLLRPDGFIFHTGTMGQSTLKGASIHSASNHTAIDLSCDLAFYLQEEKYLDMAKRIADAWLSIQGRTGLFPIAPGLHYDDLDSQTDMIIALTKLAELSKEDKYLRASEKAFMGVLKYHRQEGGYILAANVMTGETINNSYKTKFIALFIKAIYLFYSHQTIYNNKNLYEVLKDR